MWPNLDNFRIVAKPLYVADAIVAIEPPDDDPGWLVIGTEQIDGGIVVLFAKTLEPTASQKLSAIVQTLSGALAPLLLKQSRNEAGANATDVDALVTRLADAARELPELAKAINAACKRHEERAHRKRSLVE